jgi:hypothetical protein
MLLPPQSVGVCHTPPIEYTARRDLDCRRRAGGTTEGSIRRDQGAERVVAIGNGAVGLLMVGVQARMPRLVYGEMARSFTGVRVGPGRRGAYGGFVLAR